MFVPNSHWLQCIELGLNDLIVISFLVSSSVSWLSFPFGCSGLMLPYYCVFLFSIVKLLMYFEGICCRMHDTNPWLLFWVQSTFILNYEGFQSLKQASALVMYLQSQIIKIWVMEYTIGMVVTFDGMCKSSVKNVVHKFISWGFKKLHRLGTHNTD